jgi:hypothetical protein
VPLACPCPWGLLLLIGCGAAVAFGERALGGALIALGVLSPVIGFIILLRLKKLTTAAVQAEKAAIAARVAR